MQEARQETLVDQTLVDQTVDRLESRDVRIRPSGLPGTLNLPAAPRGFVLFAHGSGSSRFSPRNKAVAQALNEHAIATLLFDLLTPQEEADRTNVFDVALLANRLVEAIRWLRDTGISDLPVGLFGASTGAAAALIAAADLPERVGAVVSRGGRPDLAGNALERVRAPTLLIVGGNDFGVIELNQRAFERLRAPKRLQIVAGATHLFSEPGAMEAVMALATQWFADHLDPDSGRKQGE